MSNLFEQTRAKTNEELEYEHRQEKLDLFRPKYRAAVENCSRNINDQVGQKILTSEGSVSSKKFSFTEQEKLKQKVKIENKENKWIRRKFNLSETAEITNEHRQVWERQQRERNSELMESALMILLNKVLKDEYIICRAHKFDDYHGVDNIIVNKRTGDVLCAFDDVNDSTEKDFYEWYKQDLVKNVNEDGGTDIEYCFTFENGELIRKKISNVPKFYMRLDMDKLLEMLEAIDLEHPDKVSQKELELYNNVIEMFAGQVEQAKAQGHSYPQYIKNLESFKELLSGLRAYGQAA